MNTSNLPVLIVGYSRRDSIMNLIEIVLAGSPRELYIALDGAKDEFAKITQREILKGVENFKESTSVPIQVLQRTENLGSGAGVISAVSWFFEHETQGIVLEDDLVVDENFFTYMNQAISILESQPRALLASGTRLISGNCEHVTLCSYPIVWGWATTRDKWNLMIDLMFSKNSFHKIRGGLSEKTFWITGKKRALNSRIDAWDIPLATGMRANGFETLVPPVNLVTNIGFDQNASHTNKLQWPLNLDRAQSLPALIQLDKSEFKKKENDEIMRREVFQISFTNILSGAVAILWDPIRFRNRLGIPDLNVRSGNLGSKE